MDILMAAYVLIILTYYILISAIGIAVNLYCKRFDVKRRNDFQPTVSVVMSCFNEGKAVYETIKSMRLSNYPIDHLEIIAIDDCSKDDSFFWMEKAAQDFSHVIVKQNKENQGKAHNVLTAAAISRGDVIVSIDSDCLFDCAAIKELVSCFSEPKIAAVGGRVGVSNCNINWLTRFQTMSYAYSFLVMKSPEKLFRKIQCLSGPLVAIRRECFNEIKREIAQRNFFGIKITNGEDRALTQMLLLRGYDTYLNIHALCYTNVPTSLPQYIKQQLRWRRSAVGQYFQTALCLSKMVLNSGFISTLFSIMPIFILLAWNMLAITSWYAGNIHVVMMFIVISHLFSGPCIALIFYYYAYQTNDSDLKKISLVDLLWSRILSAFWYPVSAVVITLFALFTLDDGGWVTRGRDDKLTNTEN